MFSKQIPKNIPHARKHTHDCLIDAVACYLLFFQTELKHSSVWKVICRMSNSCEHMNWLTVSPSASIVSGNISVCLHSCWKNKWYFALLLHESLLTHVFFCSKTKTQKNYQYGFHNCVHLSSTTKYLCVCMCCVCACFHLVFSFVSIHNVGECVCVWPQSVKCHNIICRPVQNALCH